MLRYAIREIGTDKYLPQVRDGKRQHVRHTEQEPTNKKEPRLFLTHRNARMALDCWLEGVYEMDQEDHEVSYTPRAGRYRDKMEIVTFELKEIK